MSTTPVRLLIVDDDEANRDMLGRRLERHGYAVAMAASGVEALERLSWDAIDLVLLDIQMPGMSGLEVLRRLRCAFPSTQLPIIMVTARAQSDDVVEALDLGANDYVTKPIDMAVALARIRAQVARRQAEQALVESEERYALALRGTNDGLWDWKIDSGEVFYSPRWHELVDEAIDAGPGTIDTWLGRVHPDDVERVRAELGDHVEGRANKFESEHRVRDGRGSFRWVLARGMAVRTAGGAAVRMAGSLTDITEGKVADALTGLPNRVLFVDRLTRLIEYARRNHEFHFAVLCLDVDRFKTVNDSLGHGAGDELLIQLARRIEQGLRSTDTVARVDADAGSAARVSGTTVARMGGDEFALLLAGLRQPAEAAQVAERIGQALAPPFTIAGQEVFASASIGIALSEARYTDPADMLRDADTALYRAKADGRARHVVFDGAMREEVVRRLQLETDLRRAVDRGEFVLHYQPIVSLATGQVSSVEALVRWQHPVRGTIAPGEFIGLAEETGLILPLGVWVFREVCRQLQAWSRNETHPPLTVSVNLSTRQFTQADLPDRFAAIAAEHGVPTSRLEIEITESAMIADPEAARAVVARFKELGFRLSIDDFGTGYSSLTYLQRFAVDRLKIDRSFMPQATEQAGGGIVRTVMELARHLDVEVVAEGVETVGQLEQLKSLHCGFGQGFLFLHPVEPDPLERLHLKENAAPSEAPATDDSPEDAA